MKIYLATQYTGVELESFRSVNRLAGELMDKGHIVFSPISHTHPIARECHLPTDWDYWKRFDESFIDWCDELWVSNFGDWEKSKGVCAEIEIAKRLNKSVRFEDDWSKGGD